MHFIFHGKVETKLGYVINKDTETVKVLMQIIGSRLLQTKLLLGNK